MPRQREWLVGVAVGLAVFLGGPARALGEEQGAMCPVCSKASDERAAYPSKAGYTLIRGAANTLFGWTELIRQPAQEVKAGGNVLTGIAKGMSQSVIRTFVGTGEVLTFWTPKVQRGYLHFADDCPLCMGKQK
ncbi:MAG: hypothetical protein HYY58_02595 [Candidatus Omnitrophica bacterium]|nr:hypothetical protein [Candidatus Omnitrophota bacterium]